MASLLEFLGLRGKIADDAKALEKALEIRPVAANAMTTASVFFVGLVLFATFNNRTPDALPTYLSIASILLFCVSIISGILTTNIVANYFRSYYSDKSKAALFLRRTGCLLNLSLGCVCIGILIFLINLFWIPSVRGSGVERFDCDIVYSKGATKAHMKCAVLEPAARQ